MSDVTWGFIGLGNIGYPMAINLHKNMPASHRLAVLDVNKDAMNRFVREASEWAEGNGVGDRLIKVETLNSAREVAEVSTVLITCLPSPEIVKGVFDGILEDGNLAPLEPDRLFIDCSTIAPPLSREIADALKTSGQGHFVDAPMSGGVVGARAGTLSFMYGAPDSSQLIERIESVLSCMGKTFWHMGEQGTGVASKLANNYILSINNIATAEAMNMGRHWGLDLKLLTDMIKTSTGRCWSVEVNNPVPGVNEDAPSSHGYRPGGTVNLMKKDLGLAMAGAKASGVALPLADKAFEIYQAVAETDGDRDLSVVYQWLQNQ
ncbi:hypothetical protein LTR37_020156 [Vermiconidia calcicola]|uniref:Uncharacterized protein n=1 Tax=Vermiconidia calcicola TaxID=1690605 RepID=A0ACC3MC17_9PEZI|nr:hypothetical protein LTR37_020156 [Vermiconidia calcicola]